MTNSVTSPFLPFFLFYFKLNIYILFLKSLLVYLKFKLKPKFFREKNIVLLLKQNSLFIKFTKTVFNV